MPLARTSSPYFGVVAHQRVMPRTLRSATFA